MISHGIRMSWGSFLMLATMGAGMVSCSAEGEGAQSAETDSTSSVQIALTTVPSSAQCIRITATPTSGSATVRTFPVTAGSALSGLQFGKLAPGAYTITGDAFNVSCSSIGNTVGDWLGDSVSLALRSGVTPTVTLTFRKSPSLTANANFLNNVFGVAVGLPNTFVATDTGIVQAGALNSSSTFTRSSYSTFDSTMAAGNAIVSITSTYNGACAARADGTVWCWGYSYKGELGPNLGVGSSTTTPVQVTGLTGATQVAAGAYHTCAVGTGYSGAGIYCWGDNSNGQLGVGATVTSSTSPVCNYAGSFKSVASGLYSGYAVNQLGQVASWGYNASGQLGDGTTTSRYSVFISTESPVQTVTAGWNHACSLRVDGSVRCWGENVNGQLGIGTTSSSYTPVLVSGLTARQLTAGAFHTCAINSSGQTLCWGLNASGQLGDGTNTTRLVPTSTTLGGVALTSIFGGTYAYTTCGLTASTDLYCWGSNNYGNLGDGTRNAAFLPLRVTLQ